MAKTSKRPRVFYGWWVVAASSLIAGVGSVNTMGFSVFFIPLSREIGVSRAVLSIVPSISRLEGGMLGPVMGWVIDNVGARRVLALGSLLGGLGLILMGIVVHSVWSLFLVYMVFIGMGFNMGFFPGAIATINSWFIRRRTVAMSIVNATWGGAAFVLVPLISFITLRYGWRTAAIVAGGLVMSTAIPAMLVIRRSPESMGLLPDGRAPSPENTVSKPGAVTATPGFVGGATDFTVGQAVRTRAFWLLVVAANLRMMTYSPILVHFVPLLVWKGLSQQGAANLIGLWSLLVIPASLIVGYVGDRWNKRVLLSGATLVGAVAFLVLGTFHHPAFLYLFLLLLAPFDNLGVVNWSLLGEMFGRKNFATLRGIIAGVGSIGAAASPVYAGLVWDKTGSYTWALVPFAGALVVSAVIYVFLPRPKVLAPAAQPVAEKTPTP